MRPRTSRRSAPRRWSAAAFALLAVVAAPCWTSSGRALAASPEPWSDTDPQSPPTRYELGDFGVRGGAEYRANVLYIDPLDLTAESNRKINIIEHRLRLDATTDWMDKVRITTSMDVMDGVLWGDNGSYGGEPESTSGANVNSNNVNAAKVCVRQTGASTVDPKSYQHSLCPADYLHVRRLYGDVVTPIGLFRIGRQAFTEGAAVALNDGNGRRNRFGVTNRGNTVDRILFATKPLEAFKAPDMRDRSENKGIFLVLAYDRNVVDEPMKLGDDVQTWVTAVRALDPAPQIGLPFRDVEARLFHGYRFDRRNDTKVNAIGGRVSSRYGKFYGGLDAAAFIGETSEVSKAFAVVTNDPVQSQAIRQLGARAVARYDTRWWTAYLEADYASGDSDPQVGTPLTQFRFSEDSTVGLLLFKHVFAYQTARASAAGVELLRSLNAPTLPVEAIASRGAFTNAMAIFPQFDVRPTKDLLFRTGVLMAWAPAPVHDPVQSQQKRDGTTISDDLVNFNGGKPGKFYGTEVDARVQWRYLDHFAFDLEGAILFPGDALEDQDGNAVRSVMVQGRTTFFF